MPLFNADGSKPQPPPPAILPGSSAPLGHRWKVVVAVPSAAQEDSLEFQALAVTAQAVKEHLGRVFGRDRVVVYDRMSVIDGEWNEDEVTAMILHEPLALLRLVVLLPVVVLAQAQASSFCSSP